jgi:hypothetical protein
MLDWPMTTTSKPRYHQCFRRSVLTTWAVLLTLLASAILPSFAMAQPNKSYLLPDEKGLEMVVHILGEVQKPGEYRVSDNTDVLELIAVAGGTTEYSNLGRVRIRRVMPVQVSSTKNNVRLTPGPEILKIDLTDAWRAKSDDPPPRLLPGDVVEVSRNSWFGYKRFATVLRDAAVVASAYFLYLRVVEDN